MNWSQSWQQPTLSLVHQWCFAVCPVAAHVDRLKSSPEVQKRRWFHSGFKPLLLKGFQGLSHTVLQTSQFHSRDSSRNSQRHTLLALHCLASCWKAAGMCSFSLYLVDLPYFTHVTLLCSMFFQACAVISCLSKSLLLNPILLLLTGFQTGIRLCHIGRQGQA